MYIAVPEAGAPPRAPAAPTGLRLARVAHQLFGVGGPFGWDDHIYFPDLMRSYGLECRPSWFTGRRNSFTDMVAAMVPRLSPLAGPFDVAVLTGVTPDSQPGFPMCHLSHLVPGSGLAFAIADQGVVAPFTALHTLATVLRADRAARGMLLVMDQHTLLHDEPVPARLRVERDSAVALVFDRDGQLGTVSPPLAATGSATEVGAHLDDMLRDEGTAVSLVLGYGLGGYRPPPRLVAEVCPAEPGLPATGIWAALATHLPRWQRSGARVVLADYDVDQNRLSACTLDVPAGGGAP